MIYSETSQMYGLYRCLLGREIMAKVNNIIKPSLANQNYTFIIKGLENTYKLIQFIYLM